MRKKIFLGTCLLFCLQLSHAHRRIVGGDLVKMPKRYVVYFLKAETSNRTYDAWLCGGAIVSPSFIVTSAACVEDVQHMYAIAGYRRYVNSNKLREDKCLKFTKKKVVLTCVPKVYEFSFDKVEKWSKLDIAVVKVESPYDFNDKTYQQLCDYAPSMIRINYEEMYQKPGTEVMVFGWGHSNIWRFTNDSKDHNEKYLHYASTVIIPIEDCKPAYENYEIFGSEVDKYIICTNGKGHFNDFGEKIVDIKEYGKGCSNKKLLKGVPVCDDDSQILDLDYRRRDDSKEVSGICQNDHGGPLITWVGLNEVLVGVASVFRIDSQSKCSGPFLYASTQCNGAFLRCIIDGDDEKWIKNHEDSKIKDEDPSDTESNPKITKLRSYPGYQEYMGYVGHYPYSRRFDECDLPPKERGYEVIRRHISWVNHPDGPAENERKKIKDHRPSYGSRPNLDFGGESLEEIMTRPQLPINR